ncbi:high mobility group protein B1-like [Haliotis cracherodii]|uniref:high mobility group protein B1-like n=1 Tax=Haliotis cracherodii TaxID=6455 RepID=UPI0039EC26CD
MGRTKAESPKKRKRVKDLNKPKRSTSAYFYFLAHCREKAQKEGRSISKIAEFTKECSALWKDMNDTTKKPFNDKAETDKLRYQKEMGNYKPPKGGKTGGKVEDGKPKRPQSAYFLFLADHRKECKGKDIGHKDILRQAGEKWRKLTDDEKKPYEKGALEEQKKYEKAMEEWRKGGPSAAKKTKQSNGKSEDDDDEEEEDEEEEEGDDDDEEEEDDDEDDE